MRSRDLADRPTRLGPAVLAALFIAAATVTALDYGFGVGDPTLDARRDIHQRVLDGTARAPDRYRPLTPFLLEGPIRLVAWTMPRPLAFDRVYTLFYLAAMVSLLWSLFAYLRVWFTDEQALMGALLVASTLRITIRQHDYGPGSFLEASFVAWGLLMILHDRRIWLGVLLVVASLNRETGVFLVLLFAATHELTSRNLRAAAIYGSLWALVFVGTRVLFGEADRYWDLERIWHTNLSQPGLAAYNITALLGVVWLLTLFGIRRAPPFVQQAARVAPIYLLTVAIWGIWWEVRLLLPLVPLVLPLAWSYLFEPRREAQSLSGAVAR